MSVSGDVMRSGVDCKGPALRRTAPRILILTLSHGAAHQRAARALREAFLDLWPDLQAQVIDTLEHCTGWFRAYYNSYLIPLRVWPGLWRWIESIQHESHSTGPPWLYRRGARPFFKYLGDYSPHAVVATEVGMCELAVMYKREARASFLLAGLELMDFNRAWIHPEVDLFLTTHLGLASELVAAGAPSEKVVTTGQPLDRAFTSLPDRDATRAKLGIPQDTLQILALFGGAGFGNAERLLREVSRVKYRHELVMITGRNQRLERRLRKLCAPLPGVRVLGWVDNMHEWMVASDLLISKPGGETLTEGFACGLPMLAFDPLPGNEERTCQWIEKWQAGIWIKKPEELAPTIEALLEDPSRLSALRQRASALGRPQAARDAAQAILDRLAQRPP